MDMMVESPMILAIDIGTSSVRVSLFDAQARALPGLYAQSSYQLRTTPDGGATLDPDEVCQQLFECLDRVIDQAGDRANDIVAAGCCTLVANVLGVDDQGQAISPLYTWADARGREAVEWLRAGLDENEVHQRTGCLLHTSYLSTRLRWIQSARPELFRQVQQWLSIDDYLRLRLFGRSSTSYSVASWTGLLNRHSLQWDEPLLAMLGISAAHLPPLRDRDQAQSGLSPKYARRWPALANIRWYPGLGDGAASNLGGGGASPDRFVVNLGTSAAIRVTVPGSPVTVPAGLWCYRIDRDLSLLGGALSNAGNLYEWLLRTLQLDSPAGVEEQLAALEPDAHGLTFLPFLAGERAPGWSADARGALIGLGLHTRPIDILRAGIDAVSYRLALIHDLLAPVVPDAQEVIVSGGAAGSTAWIQTLADVLNRPVLVSAETEASSRGVATATLQAAGIMNKLEDMAPPAITARYSPDQGRHQIYRQAMARHVELYRRLTPHP